MTAQSMETIFIDGVKHWMAAEPFGVYLGKLKERPELFPPDTACWRGYYGKWEIRDDKLFLTDLDAYVTHRKGVNTVGLHYFFPGQKEVFAEWFSGRIKIPMGELLEYVHMGYEAIYEKDLFLDIKDGVVMSRTEIENEV